MLDLEGPPLERLSFHPTRVINRLSRLWQEAELPGSDKPGSRFRQSVLELARAYTPVVHTTKRGDFEGLAFKDVGPRTTLHDWAILAWRVHTVLNLVGRDDGWENPEEIYRDVERGYAREGRVVLGVGLLSCWPVSLWYEVYSALNTGPRDLRPALARYLLGLVRDYDVLPPRVELSERGAYLFRFPTRMGLGEWAYLHLAQRVLKIEGRFARCKGCGRVFLPERQGRVCSERCKKRLQRAKD